MVTWGAIAAAMMFIKGPHSFYWVRFLLGSAEAGFFPGIIFYLTFWYPNERRAHAIASFMTAVAISGVIGNPISGFLLQMHGRGGLAGWQWLFLLEGIPTVLLGVLTFFILPDTPRQARWLSAEEKGWLQERLGAEQARPVKAPAAAPVTAFLRSLLEGRILLITLLYVALEIALYSFIYWMPQLIKARIQGLSNQQIGLIAAIPSVGAAIGMVVIGKLSDHFNERCGHIAVSSFIGVAGLILTAYTTGPVLLVAALTVAFIGILGVFAPFWSLSAACLGAMAMAGGIAFINSIGNLVGGFYGPKYMAKLIGETKNYTAGYLMLALALTLCGLLALALKYLSRRDPSQETS